MKSLILPWTWVGEYLTIIIRADCDIQFGFVYKKVNIIMLTALKARKVKTYEIDLRIGLHRHLKMESSRR